MISESEAEELVRSGAASATYKDRGKRRHITSCTLRRKFSALDWQPRTSDGYLVMQLDTKVDIWKEVELR